MSLLFATILLLLFNSLLTAWLGLFFLITVPLLLLTALLTVFTQFILQICWFYVKCRISCLILGCRMAYDRSDSYISVFLYSDICHNIIWSKRTCNWEKSDLYIIAGEFLNKSIWGSNENLAAFKKIEEELNGISQFFPKIRCRYISITVVNHIEWKCWQLHIGEIPSNRHCTNGLKWLASAICTTFWLLFERWVRICLASSAAAWSAQFDMVTSRRIHPWTFPTCSQTLEFFESSKSRDTAFLPSCTSRARERTAYCIAPASAILSCSRKK